MWTWVIDLRGIDAVFFGCAAIGGAIFLIRLLMIFIGLDHDGDGLDLDHDHDLGAGVLSVTTLTGFFTVFGVTGLVMRLEEGAGPTTATLVAFVAGGAVMVALAKMLTLIYRMRSSGNIKAANAVGNEGSVYLTIPADGRGQVEVAVQGRLKIMDAMTERPEELKTGTSIRVVRVVEGDVLVVERA